MPCNGLVGEQPLQLEQVRAGRKRLRLLVESRVAQRQTPRGARDHFVEQQHLLAGPFAPIDESQSGLVHVAAFSRGIKMVLAERRRKRLFRQPGDKQIRHIERSHAGGAEHADAADVVVRRRQVRGGGDLVEAGDQIAAVKTARSARQAASPTAGWRSGRRAIAARRQNRTAPTARRNRRRSHARDPAHRPAAAVPSPILPRSLRAAAPQAFRSAAKEPHKRHAPYRGAEPAPRAHRPQAQRSPIVRPLARSLPAAAEFAACGPFARALVRLAGCHSSQDGCT